MRKITFFILCLVMPVMAYADSIAWQQPLDVPIALSASYGELRPNHFHAGLDMKTEQRCGLPVRAVQDGYVSRISVAQFGYGNCLYVTHPQSGYVTVYAHLDAFNDSITAWIKEYQYQNKTSLFNAELPDSVLVVKQGEVIALSGNTGSSGGPHLHFEVRDSTAEKSLDPQQFYPVKDHVRPKFQKVGVRPIGGEGLVANQCIFKSYAAWQQKVGNYVAPTIQAWGKLGLEFMAFDYMDGQSNFYGLKSLHVLVDSVLTFSYRIDGFSFDDDKAINAFIDYEQWIKNHQVYMCAYLPSYQPLSLFAAQGDGTLTIQEERDYHIEAIASDYAGNKSVLRFVIKGKKSDMPSLCQNAGQLFTPKQLNYFQQDSVRLLIPRGAIYNDMSFRYVATYDSLLATTVHSVHYNTVPLHLPGIVQLPIDADTLQNKKQYYLAYKNQYGRWGYVNASYQDGCMEGKISKFGDYVVKVDTVPPVINMLSRGRYKLMWRIGDGQSGVASFNAYIDDQWVACSIDAKSRVSYYYDKTRIKPGKHNLRIEVVDMCGNVSTYQTKVQLGG
jgi:hypothetical protein